jgi:hypothetical protein
MTSQETSFTPFTIYKQFYTYVPLNKMQGLQWFALTKNYGSSYGPIQKSYRFKRTPRLLDLGNADIRIQIRDSIKHYEPSIIRYTDPDEQYSGSGPNRKYHQLLEKYLGDKYDGTIIDESHLQGNEELSAEDLEGPSEIVLWSNSYPDLLEEIPVLNGGRTIKKWKRKPKKKGKGNYKGKCKNNGTLKKK